MKTIALLYTGIVAFTAVPWIAAVPVGGESSDVDLDEREIHNRRCQGPNIVTTGIEVFNQTDSDRNSKIRKRNHSGV